MSDLHLNDLADLVYLLIVQVLLHDESLVSLGVNVAISVNTNKKIFNASLRLFKI